MIQRQGGAPPQRECDFRDTLRAWIQARIAAYHKSIKARREDYRRRNWGGVDRDDRIQRYTRIINRLEDLRRQFNNIINAAPSRCADVLVLANIVYNEDSSERGL